MERLPISVCMVSGAEAHRIQSCLQTVREWAAELVVVLDDRTADDTERLVREAGGAVFREPWKGFVGQKNSAFAKASQPWLLNLDADEAVSPPLQQELRELYQDGQRLGRFSGFSFPRCSFYCGRWIRHGDWYPDRVLRLCRRGHGQWAGEEPHAQLRVQGRTNKLRSDLLHHTNENIARHIAKIAPYHSDAVRERVATGTMPGVLEWVVRPWWRFIRAYFFRLGFLDGWQGYYIARVSAFSTLTRLAMMREHSGR